MISTTLGPKPTKVVRHNRVSGTPTSLSPYYPIAPSLSPGVSLFENYSVQYVSEQKDFFAAMLIIYVHGGMYLLINDIDRTKARSEDILVSIILKPMTTFVARSRGN